jgi:hypothetical protein
MATVTTKQDISRWVDEGGAGPDLDGVEPIAERDANNPIGWILGTAALVCAGLVAFYTLRRT